MNGYIVFLSIFLGILLVSPGLSRAQFLSIELDVVPEISVDVQRNLDFGIIIPGQGWSEVRQSGARAGMFRIKALNSQEVFITLQAPEYLSHSNPGYTDRLPLQLEFAYNTGNSPDQNGATPIKESGKRLVLGKNGSSEDEISWNYAYIYVFGRIMVGNVTPGEYQGELSLTVEY